MKIITMIIVISLTQLAMATHQPLHCARWKRNCHDHDRYCTTGGSTALVQKSCCDILKSYESSGDFIQDQTNNTRGLANKVYLLKQSTYSTSTAYCDMTTAEGGWMVILRRADGKENFERDYDEYEDGFGELDHDFFYGLRALHDLTAQTNWELRIDFYDKPNDTESSAYATYDNFKVGCKDQGYPLQLGKFQPSEPTLLDNLREYEKQKFVARIQNQRLHPCLVGGNKGAWWYIEGECNRISGSPLTLPYPHLGWYDPLIDEVQAEREYKKYELKIRQENCLSSISVS